MASAPVGVVRGASWSLPARARCSGARVGRDGAWPCGATLARGDALGSILGHDSGVHRRRAQRCRQGPPTWLIGAETVAAEAWAPWV
jgi:hypothetical protein